jgi:hypothetical protein
MDVSRIVEESNKLEALPSCLKLAALHQDEDAALEYAIRNQRDRRNMTAGDILRCVAALDQRKTVNGRPPKTVSRDTVSPGPSANHTAELLGVSPATVNRARAVNDHASAATKQAVEQGKLSLTAAAQKTLAEKREVEQVVPPKRAGKPSQNDNMSFSQDADGSSWRSSIAVSSRVSRSCIALMILRLSDGSELPGTL